MRRQAKHSLAIWRVFLRRFRIMSLACVCIFGVTAFIAFFTPPVYLSEARILLTDPSFSSAEERSREPTEGADPLAPVRRHFLLRPILERTVGDLGLFEDRDEPTLDEKVGMLRDAITISPAISEGAEAVVLLQVRHRDAEKAAEIANGLVAVAQDHHLTKRKKRDAETQASLREEHDRLWRARAAAKRALDSYRAEREASLPSTLKAREDELGRISQSVLELYQTIQTLEQERSSLILQIQRLERRSLAAKYDPRADLLRQLEAQLAQELAVFSDSHRIVKRLKADIAALKEAIEADALDQIDEQAASEEDEVARNEVDLVEARLAELSDQKVKLERRRAVLAKSISDTAETEIRLNVLRKRIEDLAALQNALAPRIAAAERNEKSLEDGRIELQQAAMMPARPVSPNRPLILAAGAALAVLAAIGLALMLEKMNPAIRSAARMERELQITPVATVPVIRTPREKRRSYVRLAAILALAVIALPLGIIAANDHERRIRPIAENILEQVGVTSFIRALDNLQ